MSTLRPRSFGQSRLASSRQIGINKNGLYVIKQGMAGIDYVRPSWQTESVFRILPGIAPDSSPPVFDDCRVGMDQGQYGAWQCCYEAVRNFGDPGITMLLSNGDPGYSSYNSNPAWILFRAIKDAVDRKQAKSEWYPLFNRSGNRAAPLSKPQDICLMQALVFRYKDKNQFGSGQPPYGFAAEDPTVVLELSTSASQAFFGELERRKEGWDGDPHAPEAFEWSDITSLDHGAFVHFYTLGMDPREKNVQATTEVNYDPYAAKSKTGFTPGKTQEGIGYGVFMTNNLDNNDKIHPRLAGHDKKIMAKIRPWGDILEFHDDVKQAHIINKLFPASAILYAFSDHPEWILPETKAKAVDRTTVDMGRGRNTPAGDTWSNDADQDTSTDTSDVSSDDMYAETPSNQTFGETIFDEPVTKPANMTGSGEAPPSKDEVMTELAAAQARAKERKRIQSATK